MISFGSKDGMSQHPAARGKGRIAEHRAGVKAIEFWRSRGMISAFGQ